MKYLEKFSSGYCSVIPARKLALEFPLAIFFPDVLHCPNPPIHLLISTIHLEVHFFPNCWLIFNGLEETFRCFAFR
jgi:hypothetical protein